VVDRQDPQRDQGHSSYAEGADAYAERGLDGLAETWHDEIVYEEDPVFPGAATHRGRAAVLARFREYEEQLGPSAVEIRDIVERPRGVVVIWQHSGVTPAAGVPFVHRWAWVVQARDGKAVHIRAYFDPDEAQRAVGAVMKSSSPS
jgi:ketosteroid isomerase-like protein